ncbi:Lateral signaling target protein 2 like [Pseudolycoriella hygida]|uniref:Lateral signaling target protein 2 homolog n=1 Tax=Pseudolycoriella hygida TaxID=35572 RepID=A0A9Q0MTZ4_9DIPT|nr:Lateral signaling target protein 2 like [Pseudolycoriella hygida]
MADDKSILARFYYADRALTAVASELDSFDGRAEPERCSRLVARLRQGQDQVLSITNMIMDELLGEDRTSRAFRAKFPEEVLQESFAGQLWFGAECLAAGSSIMNREIESVAMRPLAKAVTKSLDNVRNLLREQCLHIKIPNSPKLNLDINDTCTETLCESLKIFDRLFAEFELLYVSAMVQVKSKQEHEMQELICVLFSETLQEALSKGLLQQDSVDFFDPALMFSIPRLAIVSGLIAYNKGPLNMSMPAEQLSEMFRPFRTLLIKIRDLLRTLTPYELYQLEKLLCTNEDINLQNNFNCDDKVNSDDELVSNVISGCCANKEIANFYSVNEALIPNEWEDDKELNDNLVTGDCASGFLIPNTNFGNLLQSNEAPLTDSFISSDDEYHSKNDVHLRMNEDRTNGNVMPADSGIGTENTSIDRSPETKTNNPVTNSSQCTESGALSENYESSWKEEHDNQSSCNQSPATETTIRISSTKLEENPSTSQSRRNKSSSSRSTSRKKTHSKIHSKQEHHTSDTYSSDDISSISDADSHDTNLALYPDGRIKFKSVENLLHRLFVCIAGVADQLQTNFASDLRQILRSVFLMNMTQPTDDIIVSEKAKDSDLFEFRASENDVIQDNAGSNQSIYSAEEVSPEFDAVFHSVQNQVRSSSLNPNTDVNPISRSGERSRSLDDDSDGDRQDYSVRSSNNNASGSNSSSNSPIIESRNPNNNRSRTSLTSAEQPPRWIPDDEAPRCMACALAFTTFRRRHHCRNCGAVFCGVCSNQTSPLPRIGLIKAVRVCRDCYVRAGRT